MARLDSRRDRAKVRGAVHVLTLAQPQTPAPSTQQGTPGAGLPSPEPRRRGPATRKFRRGPTNAAEHARRVAWGRTWGARISAATRAWKREQGVI